IPRLNNRHHATSRTLQASPYANIFVTNKVNISFMYKVMHAVHFCICANYMPTFLYVNSWLMMPAPLGKAGSGQIIDAIS
ncbi:hypothetical protein BVX99_00535, partial [bacterium F16]